MTTTAGETENRLWVALAAGCGSEFLGADLLRRERKVGYGLCLASRFVGT